jgi:circadian clock protein KaiB
VTKKRATSDPFAEFEVSRTQPKEPAYLLRLYVTGNTPQSTRAIVNLKALCESRLRGRYELTIVDLYQTPEAARAEQIVCSPTLVKRLPPPLRRLIGDLSNPDQVLLALNIEPDAG